MIPETIVVKGAAPVQLNVRVTRHGPLVSDAINANNAESKATPKPEPIEPLAFRWTALDADDGTLTAFLKVNEAHNWTEFTDALRGYVVPSQNFVYADVERPHRLLRARSHPDARLRRRFAAGRGLDRGRRVDRLGAVRGFASPVRSAGARHRHRQPPAGAAVVSLQPRPRVDGAVSGSADRRPAAAKSAHVHVGRFRPHPGRHRVVACEDAVADPPGRDRVVDDVRRCRDARSCCGDGISTRPATAPRPRSSRPGFSSSRRCSWATSSARRSRRRIRASSRSCPVFSPTPWRRTTHPGATTPRRAAHETCDEAVATAFQRGVEDLQRRMGSDLTRWRWDAVHVAMFPHALDSVAALRPIFSRSLGIGGDWSTVNVGVSAADHPYEVHTVPGYREIIDLVAGQRQPLPRRGRRVRPSAVAALRRLSERLARGHAQEDADGPRRHRPRRARASAPGAR